ncbi:PQQ-binding-like beta-propeller repeat protein [Phenylobacterium sp.]|uniref:outer membrane protein assembly factor BamB family protein n=1 Tax=Phenylobacterium sp. TaxID=1871053 RepID=UPI00356B0619
MLNSIAFSMARAGRVRSAQSCSRSRVGEVALLMAVAWFALMPVGASAQSTEAPGASIYKVACAMCHEQSGSTRAPSTDALRKLPAATLNFALTQGKMKAQGAGLTEAQRTQLVIYLTGGNAPLAKDEWSARMACPTGRPAVDVNATAPVSTFGYDLRNTRNLSAAHSGLTKAQLSNMELAWSIAIPGGATMRSQPAIVGATLFMPAPDAGALYAIDVSQPRKPCVKWTYRTQGNVPLRTSAAYGVLADGRGVIAIAGSDTTLHVIDARTGQAIWTRKLGVYSYSLITGTPVVLKDRIIVPVSQYEVAVAVSNDVQCCTNHGYVLSLDPKSGAQQWRYDTMPDARPLRDRGDGKMLYGPSGAPIWNSPAIDLKRRLVYIGTGESNSPPVERTTDAIVAIGLDDGKARWVRQGTDRDVYVEGCGLTPGPKKLNCVSDTVYRDADFGGSAVLGAADGKRPAVFAGQKSGTVWALDPESGQVIWRRALGTGGPLGGVHWGIAYDGKTVYAPISMVGEQRADEPVDVSALSSGLYALDPATGATKWSFATTPGCAPGRAQVIPSCVWLYGFSSVPSVIDGTVIQGGVDGFLYVLDGRNGRLLWKFDTAQTFTGINGVAGKGGSIDAGGVMAGHGMLFVTSGYGLYGETPGNVLLAFAPKEK